MSYLAKVAALKGCVGAHALVARGIEVVMIHTFVGGWMRWVGACARVGMGGCVACVW